ncbi:uncharacterized protein LOC127732145 [Mytilus californianus]|uniref:uncharacterized protein LOC127732145 n=1 Tax=Mytilus californianus TaxID=6549 RepID=UPI002245C44D|nr:uncharacterized protein LOC127732145 [Mytilus californianus]
MTSRSCNFSIFCNTECGLSPYYKEESTATSIAHCCKNIDNHLASVGLKSDEIPSEGHLICFRVGIFSALKSYSVCPRHRYALGICWRKKAGCAHPNHSGKAKPERAVSVDMSRAISMYNGKLVPVGSGICRKCRSVVYEQISKLNLEDIPCDVSEPECISENREKNNGLSQVSNSTACASNNCREEKGGPEYLFRQRPSMPCIQHNNNSQESSQDLQMSQTSNWSDENIAIDLSTCNTVFATLSKGEVSPLKYQLQTNFNSVTSTTQRYVERKADELICTVLNAIAPGQSKELFVHMINKHKNISEHANTEDKSVECMIDPLTKLYEETNNNIVKEQLLSIMASYTTKDTLMTKIPGITKYRVDKVRKMTFQSIYDQNKQPPSKRLRMDPVKLEHALSFFFTSVFHQIVSYGTRDLKLESGESLTVPDVVRTACHATMIQMYESFCEEDCFTPLCRSSLYNILNACAASKRRNLHGLDNITADGHSAIECIEGLVAVLEKEGAITTEKKTSLLQQVKSGKNYLKGDFKLHVSKSSECADHCIRYGLSDPKDVDYRSDCPHEHTVTCDRCENLVTLFEDISKLEFNSAEDNAEFKNAVEKINSWKSHIMRTVNQDLSRTELFDILQPHQVLIVMDWAMKFLPSLHREKQSDWFGQKGISWHVSVCIFADSIQRNNEQNATNLKHQTFVHILQSSSKQDWIAVSNFIEHIANEIKTQMPQITEIFLRSDNAGCYHCGNLWISLNGISSRTGLVIKRYDYSEAQSGKSYCDAKIAHLRRKIKMFVANGHNVTTATDMKFAIDEGAGVAGCQVAVVDIETTISDLNKVKHKWIGVSSLTNVEFSGISAIQFKAYKIGEGKVMKDVNALCSADLSQPSSALNVIELFEKPKTNTGCISKARDIPPSSNTNELFLCTESGCVCSFPTYSAYQTHIDFEKHIYKLEKMSTYDSIKVQWADSCNNQYSSLSMERGTRSGNNSACFLDQGWALKKDRKVVRFSVPVKDYLENIFLEGERTSKKANANVIAQQMRKLKNEDGQRRFSFDECLQPSQIVSYFSRLALLYKQGRLKERALQVTNISVEDDDNLTSILEEIDIHELKEQISSI